MLPPGRGESAPAARDRYEGIKRICRDWSILADMSNPVVIAIVEDDESVRESLPDLLKDFGYASRTFASAEEFLASDAVREAGCLVLDIGLPGMSGPDLRRELIRRGFSVPTIFITGHAEGIPADPLSEGAIAYLLKPLSEQELRAALDLAMPRN
jgi:FixJ family two-component response regulator